MKTNFAVTKSKSPVTEPAVDARADMAITGCPQIDGPILELVPQTAAFSPSLKTKLAHAIAHHLFGEHHSHDHRQHHPDHFHDIIDHEEARHFLDGLRILAQHHQLHDLHQLRTFLHDRVASFNPEVACDVD